MMNVQKMINDFNNSGFEKYGVDVITKGRTEVENMNEVNVTTVEKMEVKEVEDENKKDDNKIWMDSALAEFYPFKPKDYIEEPEFKHFEKEIKKPKKPHVVTKEQILRRKPVFRDYTIIDHLGSINNKKLMNKAYDLANKVSRHDKEHTYKMKEFIYKLNPNQQKEVTDKQKNKMRHTKNPDQVIFIMGEFKNKTKENTAKWWMDIWAEKVNDLKIIRVTDRIEVSTFKEEYPHFFFEDNTPMSKYRRCALIWGNALDYQFSAPLVKDPTWAMNEGFMARPDKAEISEQAGAHVSKISTRPEKFRATKAVASEEECKEFFEYYKYLYQHNLLKEFVEQNIEDGLAKYKICPHCGRPVSLHEEFCTWCNTPNADFREEYNSFFDTEETEEEA